MNKATKLHCITTKFTKDGPGFIKMPLTHIGNLSISKSKIFDDIKVARIIPIYKKNSNTEAGNYISVSILSSTSEIFEKITYQQLDHYLSDNKLLFKFQSRFWSLYSTDTCFHRYLTDYIKQKQDKACYTGW